MSFQFVPEPVFFPRKFFFPCAYFDTYKLIRNLNSRIFNDVNLCVNAHCVCNAKQILHLV